MAGGAYRSLTIELDARTSGLDAALRKSNSEASKLERELKEAKKAAKLDGAGVDTFARQMDLASGKIEAARKKLERLNEVASKEGVLNADGKVQKLSADAWSKYNYEVEKAKAEIAQYTKELRDMASAQLAANSSLGKAGAALTDVGSRLEPVGQKMQKLGGAMTMGVTVPIVGAATASVKAATDIDTALTGVRKTVDGSEEDYQRLKDAAVEFSKANAVSAATVLDIQALGAQLGFNIDELDEFAQVVAGLDIATNLDAETAATELAQFANIMGMSHDEVSNFASSLIDLGNHFSTTEADIMNMSMRIAGAGKSIGLTEADVLGLSTALASVGVEAEAGGTAISTILSNIDKDVALNSENLGRWAELVKKTPEEFAAAWDADKIGTFQEVLAAMNESDENLSVLLDDLGISSIRQTDVMKRLVNASELLPNAIETANRAYGENVALGNEVANFNDSLAAKFEMLRNRITAVAAEIGAPLADAFLEVVDAAEPLFQAIEDGARAFTEMSDEEQLAVIQTVAIIAAIGPALTLFSKVSSNVQVLGKAMTKLSGFASDVALAFGKVPAGMDAADASMATASAKAKLASTAMDALKGAAIGLAVAGIAVLASAIADCVKKQAEFDKATDGLSQAARSIPSHLEVAALGASAVSESVDSAAESWVNYSKVAQDSAAKGAELTDSVNQAFSNAEVDARLAQQYADTIANLAGNCDGSADKLFELQDAVSRYNELTGSSIEVVDSFTGTLNTNTAELQANTDAYKLNAYAKAAGDVYGEALKREVELQVQLDDAYAQQERRMEKINELKAELADPANVDRQDELNAAIDMQEELYRKDAAAIEDLVEQHDAAAETAQKALDRQTDYQKTLEASEEAARRAAANIDGFTWALQSAGEGSDAFAALAEHAGMNAEEFGTALTRAGLKTQDLAAVGSEQFKMLYDRANRDITGVSQLLIALNAMGIDPKTLTVNDDGTLSDAEGHIIDLDAMTIDSKSIAVYLEDYATNQLRELRDIATRLNGFVVNIRTQVSGGVSGLFGNAAGGLSTVPIQMARHADGGIVSRPTLTNVGWVGEAGAEAIIPLTNKRYVQPFANAVADAMGTGGTVNNLNVTLQYDAGDDAKSMAAEFTRIVRDNLNMGR